MKSLEVLTQELLALREREQELLKAYTALLLEQGLRVGDKVRVFDLEISRDTVLKIRKLEVLYNEVLPHLPELRYHLAYQDGAALYFKSYPSEMLEHLKGKR